MSCNANGVTKFIQVHESCLTDFIKDFDNDFKIMCKEAEVYTLYVFIMDESTYPECKKDED